MSKDEEIRRIREAKAKMKALRFTKPQDEPFVISMEDGKEVKDTRPIPQNVGPPQNSGHNLPTHLKAPVPTPMSTPSQVSPPMSTPAETSTPTQEKGNAKLPTSARVEIVQRHAPQDVLGRFA